MLNKLDQQLRDFVWQNLTRNQATDLAAILESIARETKSFTTGKVANSIIKAATGF